MSTDFGKRLKQARNTKKITQAKLAKAVGMPQSTLAQAESTGYGSVWTPLLAAELGVNALWLATGEGAMAMDINSPPRQAANDAEEFSPLARSLARLFDSLPVDDHVLRSKAYSEASKPLLVLLDPPPGNQPTPEPAHGPEKPTATPPKPTVRHK